MLMSTFTNLGADAPPKHPGPMPPGGTMNPMYFVWYQKYRAYKKALEQQKVRSVTHTRVSAERRAELLKLMEARKAGMAALNAALTAGQPLTQAKAAALQAIAAKGVRGPVADQQLALVVQRSIVFKGQTAFKQALAAGQTKEAAREVAKQVMIKAGMSATDADAIMKRAAEGVKITKSTPKPGRAKKVKEIADRIRNDMKAGKTAEQAAEAAVQWTMSSLKTSQKMATTLVKEAVALIVQEAQVEQKQAVAKKYPPGSFQYKSSKTGQWHIMIPKGTTLGSSGLGEQTHVQAGTSPTKIEGLPEKTEAEGKKAGAPFYKTWWFWAAVAGGTLALGTGGYLVFKRK